MLTDAQRRIANYTGEKRRHAQARALRKGERIDARNLQTWQAARVAEREAEVTWEGAALAVWREAREIALGFMSPAKRKIAPQAPEVFTYVAAAEAQRAWYAAVPKAKHADLNAALQPLGERIAKFRDRVDEAVKARKLAAAKIETPVIGKAARWQCVDAVYLSRYATQTWPDGYARASATLRFRELQAIGYTVRLVARQERPRADGFYSKVWCYEVWAITCDDGRSIVPHQYPVRSIDEMLNTAADEGVNPIALYGNLVPVKLAIASGAMDCRTYRPPHVAQILLAYDEPFPVK